MYILAEACKDASFAATILFSKKLIDIIFIVGPILLILLLTIDFSKAVMAGDDNKIQQVKSTAIKRIIFAVILFFVPLIVDTAFSLLDNDKGNVISCYNKVDDSYVDNLVKKLEADTKEKEAQREKTVSDIRAKQKSEAAKRDTQSKSASNKIEKKSNTSAVKSGSRVRANGKIAEASSSGLQIVSFNNGLKRWKWEYVFRFKDPKKAELAAQCMEAGVANKKHIKYCNPYGQLYDKTKNKGFDVSKVKSKTCTTCSPFVSVCVNYSGIRMKKAWNAANEASTLSEIKKLSKHFEIIHSPKTAQNYTKLYRGDILFKNKYNGMGHTVMAT